MFNGLDKNQRTTIIITGMITLAGLFVFAFGSYQSNLDKGFKLCEIVAKADRGYSDAVRGCVNKYAELELNLDGRYDK